MTAQILGPDDSIMQAEQYQRTAVVGCMTSEDLRKKMETGMSGSGFLGDSLAATNTTNGSFDPLRATAKAVFPPHVNIPNAKDAIFSGRRVYFASDLGLRTGLEKALMQRISDAGGSSWSATIDGAKVVDAAQNGRQVDQWEKRRVAEKELKQANTVIMRTREGWEFWIVRHASLCNGPRTDVVINSHTKRKRRSGISLGCITSSPSRSSPRPSIDYFTTLSRRIRSQEPTNSN